MLVLAVVSLFAADAVVLGTSGGPAPLEAYVGPCEKESRAVRVRPRGSKEVGLIFDDPKADSGWSYVSCPVRRQPADARYPWIAGDDEHATELFARAVPLEGAPSALLVTLQAGFEHTHRRHILFVPDGKTVRRAWTGGENAGPAASHVYRSGEDWIYEWVFYGPGMADIFRRSKLVWNAKRTRVEERPAPIWMTVLATHGTEQAALEAEARCCAEDHECGARLFVLETDAYAGFSPGKRVLVEPHASESEANGALSRWKRCAPDAFVRKVTHRDP